MPEAIRYAFAVGTESTVPQLPLGIPGWDADTKTGRVGDDTPSPPRFPTTKSRGRFEFEVATFKFKTVELFNDGTVDGVTPSRLNAGQGLVARYDDNQWRNVEIVNDDGYLEVAAGNGVLLLADGKPSGGNPRINLSQKLLTELGLAQGGFKFYYGELPPPKAVAGSIFYSTVEYLLYMRIQDDVDNLYWVDFSSVGGGGDGAGNRTWVGNTVPARALVGDTFLQSNDNYRRFLYDRDAGGVFWREILI